MDEYIRLTRGIPQAPIADVGVIVARFQTPQLTSAHKRILLTAIANHQKVLVVLGVAPILNSKRDPLDFATRLKMLQSFSNRLMVLPLKDHVSDECWSDNLDSLIRAIFPIESVLLYGGEDSFMKSYSGKFKTFQMPKFDSRHATEERETAAHTVLDSYDFRAGVIYGQANQYIKTVPCVDVIPTKGDEILVARKEGKTKWQFVGGHVERETLEATVVKEVQEEAGFDIGDLVYLGSMVVNDWRYRREDSKIVTALFTGKYVMGPTRAGDDVVEVKWIRWDSGFDILTQSHLALYGKFLDYRDNKK